MVMIYMARESEDTKLTSSTIDDTGFPILNWYGSRGSTTVSVQRIIIFEMQVDPYWPKWFTQCFKLATKDFVTSEFDQVTWNRYLLLGFALAHIPWNAISSLEPSLSYRALWSVLEVPSTMTLSNICWWEYALTVGGIKKELPSRNEVCSAINR